MKLTGQTIVLIPWFDSDGMKQWVRLSFDGEMTDDFMYRQVRLYIKKEFDKKIDKRWIKAMCPILNEHRDNKGKPKTKQITSDTAFTQMIEEFIKGVESNEDEDRADYILQTGNPEGTVQQVRPVQDKG